LKQKYKFLIAGGSNTVITFALYALMVNSGLNYNLSLVVSYVTGIALGFLFNRLWTFANTENLAKPNGKSTSTQFVRYLLVYGLIFMVNFLILNLLVQAFKLNPILSQLVAVGVSTVCSYLLQKSWVFRS